MGSSKACIKGSTSERLSAAFGIKGPFLEVSGLRLSGGGLRIGVEGPRTQASEVLGHGILPLWLGSDS